MTRNLDMTALRSLVGVVDAGGVTRAAGFLNLTQSAVSMQIKRLEDMLGLSLFARGARRLTLTPEGEQLLSYARQMVALNDEAMARMTCSSFEGEIRLGVPHDIVFPAIPGILKHLAALFPRVRVNLVSSFTILMKESFARGALDVIVTTETQPAPGGEIMGWRDLVWIGAVGGTAWQRRPLRLGFKDSCIFRPAVQTALTGAGLPWDMAYDGESEQAIEATVAADLAISARLDAQMPAGTERIDDRGALPPLGRMAICLYQAPTLTGPAGEALLAELRRAYCCEPVALAAE